MLPDVKHVELGMIEDVDWLHHVAKFGDFFLKHAVNIGENVKNVKKISRVT